MTSLCQISHPQPPLTRMRLEEAKDEPAEWPIPEDLSDPLLEDICTQFHHMLSQVQPLPFLGG